MPGCLWKCTDCSTKTSNQTNLNLQQNQGNVTELLQAILSLQSTVQALQDDIKELKLNQQTVGSDTFKMEEVIQEIAERQKREANIIIFKLPENVNCKQQVVDIIKKIAPEVITDQLTIRRLGTGNGQKPAPVKVTLNSSVDVIAVLKNKRKLKDSFPQIVIATDQTKMQQEYYKKVKGELLDRQNKGESDLYIKYVNGVPRISKSKNY